MQQREKVLAIALGGVVLLWAGSGIVMPLVRGPIDRRENELAAATRESEKATAEEDTVFTAVGDLAKRRRVALGGDPLSAQRAYLSWLTDLATTAGWSDVVLRPDQITPLDDGVDRIGVSGSAVATPRQLADFLARYDAAELLHDLSRLTLETESTAPNAPIEIDLASQAIVMADGEVDELLPPSATLAGTWAALADGSPLLRPEPPATPRNAPPELLMPDPVTIAVGETATEFALALDPDGRDEKIRYRLAEAITGATVDAETGEMTYDTAASAPAEKPLSDGAENSGAENSGEKAQDEEAEDEDEGEEASGAADQARSGPVLGPVAIRLEAVDEAGEVASGVWTVTIEANAALTTELVGSLVLDTEPVAWLIDRSDGSRTELRAGDVIAIGRVEGRVERVTPDAIEYRDGDRRYRLRLGQKLVDAEPVGS